jgi:hypothetical protein
MRLFGHSTYGFLIEGMSIQLFKKITFIKHQATKQAKLK